jgi:hypothetical protein
MKDSKQESSFEVEWNDSDTLVIAIKGYANKLGIPVDKFFRRAGLERASKIIIWDASRLKTLGGLQPDFPTFGDLLNHLRMIIATHPHKKLYVTGSSGGGHTGLLLGHLLKADKVIVFAPYPYVSRKVSEYKKDPAIHSMARMLHRFDQLPDDVRPYFDLADVLVDWNGKTEYYVHVSRYHKWDYIRACYLRGLPKVKVVTHPYEEHSITSILGESQDFRDCFTFPYRRRRSLRRLLLHWKCLKNRLSKKTPDAGQ